MSQVVLPDNAGAVFFGFMGVSVALVLASTYRINQTLVQHMALLKQVQESVVFQYGDLQL